MLMAIRLLDTLAGARSFPTLVGKDSIMAALARPTLDVSPVTEILEFAHNMVRHNRDHDLIQKIIDPARLRGAGGNESRPHLRRHDSESLRRFDGARPSDG